MNLLTPILNSILANHGFKKSRKAVWNRILPEVLQQIGIETPSYGKLYNLRIGVNPLVLDGRRDPPMHQMLMQWQSQEIVPRRLHLRFLDATDLGSSMTLAEREEVLSKTICFYVLPIMDDVHDLKAVKRAAFDESSSHYTIYTRFETLDVGPK